MFYRALLAHVTIFKVISRILSFDNKLEENDSEAEPEEQKEEVEQDADEDKK